MSERFFKRVFLAGALWNLLGGAIIWTFTPWIFSLDNLRLPVPGAYYYTWVAMILVFGIGYYMVFLDLYGNKSVVLMGILGKLAFSAIFLWHVWRGGSIPRFFLIPVIGDLVFVALFAVFLAFARAKGRPGDAGRWSP